MADNPITALMSGDAQAFRERVNDMLLQKLSDRLELEKTNVAASMLASPVSDEESEEETVAQEEPSEDEENV